MKPPRRKIKPRSSGQLNHRRWRNLRDRVVREEPYCTLRLPGCTLVSTTGDHIIPVSMRPDLKFDRANVRGSCWSCNNRRGNEPLGVVRARLSRRTVPAPALGFFQ